MKLIQHFDFNLSVPDCLPDADYFRTSVSVSEDISEILPYLNAEFEGAEFNTGARVLIWKENDKRYAFHSREIDITPVKDIEEAQKLVDSIVSRVNDIWDRRTEIEPNFEGRKPLPNVLDIYKKLPRTNCRECGYLSCMAFAAVLREYPDKRCLCPHLTA